MGFHLVFDLVMKAHDLVQLPEIWSRPAEHPVVLQEKIDKELRLGWIAGPFSTPPFPHYRCSPIGVVPKQAPGEFRLIHNLSSPLGNSVNKHIDPSNTSVSYTSFDDAVTLV